MRKEIFSGFFILIFLLLTGVPSVFYIHEAQSKNPESSLSEIIKGEWSSRFERSFSEAIPLFDPSRNIWTYVEYLFFHEGRKGVLVGKDNWLFTEEEFSCPNNYKKNLLDNMKFILNTKHLFEQNNTKLFVALVPAKSRVYRSYLGEYKMPSCRLKLYEKVFQFLRKYNIPSTNLLNIMLQKKNDAQVFFKTDTHWTPKGARLSALGITSDLPWSAFPRKKFVVKSESEETHKGDLLRYLPGIKDSAIEPDHLTRFSTIDDGSGSNLFDDSVPPVVLVGTSYSANPLWNFEGFLKQSLKADILNMADEGLGPFAVMDKYLQSKSWKEMPPKIVIWEMPERYMLFPHDIGNNISGVNHKKVF